MLIVFICLIVIVSVFFFFFFFIYFVKQILHLFKIELISNILPINKQFNSLNENN